MKKPWQMLRLHGIITTGVDVNGLRILMRNDFHIVEIILDHDDCEIWFYNYRLNGINNAKKKWQPLHTKSYDQQTVLFEKLML